MSFEGEINVLGVGLAVGGGLYLVSIAIAMVRIVRGPSSFDRVVAFDLLSGLTLGIMVLLGLGFGQPVLLDAALAIAVAGFLGTVAFARYLERGGSR